MRSIALTFALLASYAAAGPAPEQPPAPIDTYLEEADKKIELEQIVARYGGGGSDASVLGTAAELRPLFDLAYEAAGASKDAQDALDEHWLVVNRCLNARGDNKFEKSQQRGACNGDLAAAKAKVELKWSRHKP